MKRDVINRFLDAYRKDGIVDNCVKVIELKLMPPELSEDLQKLHFNKTFVDKIIQEAASFDSADVSNTNSNLIKEIENQLAERSTKQEKERYLNTLIASFHKLSELYYPSFVKQRIDKEIAKEYRSALNERFETQSNWFWEKFHNPTDEIETVLAKFLRLSHIFANQIDALCLKYDIDFLKIQRDCGVCLKTDRCVDEIAPFIGSYELACHYINALERTDTDTKTNDCTARNPKPQNGNNECLRYATFADHLTCKEELRPKLIELLKKTFKGKGKMMATMVCCLEQRGLIVFEDKAKLHGKIKSEFGDIGEKRGFTKFLVRETAQTNTSRGMYTTSLNQSYIDSHLKVLDAIMKDIEESNSAE